MATYTWRDSRTTCDATTHRTEPTCPDCQDPTPCAGCGNTIPAGARHLYCGTNGETAHNRECAQAAEAAWGDDNW